MVHFEREQSVVNIGGLSLGGQPGEYPTVLMAAMFYAGDQLVPDVQRADFDRAGAAEAVDRAESMCSEVGVPLVLDVICATPDQARAFVGFALEESDAPVLMDGTTPEVRLAGLEAAAERGAQERVIFNAISDTATDEELRRTVNLGFESAVLMLLNSKDPTARGKTKVAGELIPRAQDLGFRNLLLDLAVLDIVDVGTCAVALRELKEEFGLPCGCSPTHTHRDRWAKASLFETKAQAAAKVSCATMLQCAGADFVMYDIKQTEVIPAMAMVDAEIAYGARTWKVRPRTDRHPLYRIFR
ncbi:MAG: methylcobalamin--tetrahydrofolate methyltransferase [Deferrisomatales bacterium]